MNKEIIEMVKASRAEQRINNLSDAELIELCLNLIQDARKRIGQNEIKPDILQITIQDLFENLKSRFAFFSIYEIQLAFKMGAGGELSDADYSINTRVVIKWINIYQSRIKPEINKEIMKIPKERQIEHKPSKEDDLRLINSVYQQWLQIGIGTFIPAYDAADRLDILPKFDKWELVKLAVSNIEGKLKNQVECNKILKVVYKEQVNSIKNINYSKPSTVPNIIKAECFRLFILKWFNELKQNEISEIKI